VNFIGRLNSANVGAIVTTKHQIPYKMAAQFTGCLVSAMTSQTVSTPTSSNVSYAVFDAVQCLRKEKEFDERYVDRLLEKPAWGARALAYTLIGNGGLMACPPRKEMK